MYQNKYAHQTTQPLQYSYSHNTYRSNESYRTFHQQDELSSSMRQGVRRSKSCEPLKSALKAHRGSTGSYNDVQYERAPTTRPSMHSYSASNLSTIGSTCWGVRASLGQTTSTYNYPRTEHNISTSSSAPTTPRYNSQNTPPVGTLSYSPSKVTNHTSIIAGGGQKSSSPTYAHIGWQYNNHSPSANTYKHTSPSSSSANMSPVAHQQQWSPRQSMTSSSPTHESPGYMTLSRCSGGSNSGLPPLGSRIRRYTVRESGGQTQLQVPSGGCAHGSSLSAQSPTPPLLSSPLSSRHSSCHSSSPQSPAYCKNSSPNAGPTSVRECSPTISPRRTVLREVRMEQDSGRTHITERRNFDSSGHSVNPVGHARVITSSTDFRKSVCGASTVSTTTTNGNVTKVTTTTRRVVPQTSSTTSVSSASTASSSFQPHVGGAAPPNTARTLAYSSKVPKLTSLATTIKPNSESTASWTRETKEATVRVPPAQMVQVSQGRAVSSTQEEIPSACSTPCPAPTSAYASVSDALKCKSVGTATDNQETESAAGSESIQNGTNSSNQTTQSVRNSYNTVQTSSSNTSLVEATTTTTVNSSDTLNKASHSHLRPQSLRAASAITNTGGGSEKETTTRISEPVLDTPTPSAAPACSPSQFMSSFLHNRPILNLDKVHEQRKQIEGDSGTPEEEENQDEEYCEDMEEFEEEYEEDDYGNDTFDDEYNLPEGGIYGQLDEGGLLDQDGAFSSDESDWERSHASDSSRATTVDGYELSTQELLDRATDKLLRRIQKGKLTCQDKEFWFTPPDSPRTSSDMGAFLGQQLDRQIQELKMQQAMLEKENEDICNVLKSSWKDTIEKHFEHEEFLERAIIGNLATENSDYVQNDNTVTTQQYTSPRLTPMTNSLYASQIPLSVGQLPFQQNVVLPMSITDVVDVKSDDGTLRSSELQSSEQGDNTTVERRSSLNLEKPTVAEPPRPPSPKSIPASPKTQSPRGSIVATVNRDVKPVVPTTQVSPAVAPATQPTPLIVATQRPTAPPQPPTCATPPRAATPDGVGTALRTSRSVSATPPPLVVSATDLQNCAVGPPSPAESSIQLAAETATYISASPLPIESSPPKPVPIDRIPEAHPYSSTVAKEGTDAQQQFVNSADDSIQPVGPPPFVVPPQSEEEDVPIIQLLAPTPLSPTVESVSSRCASVTVSTEPNTPRPTMENFENQTICAATMTSNVVPSVPVPMPLSTEQQLRNVGGNGLTVPAVKNGHISDDSTTKSSQGITGEDTSSESDDQQRRTPITAKLPYQTDTESDTEQQAAGYQQLSASQRSQLPLTPPLTPKATTSTDMSMAAPSSSIVIKTKSIVADARNEQAHEQVSPASSNALASPLERLVGHSGSLRVMVGTSPPTTIAAKRKAHSASSQLQGWEVKLQCGTVADTQEHSIPLQPYPFMHTVVLSVPLVMRRLGENDNDESDYDGPDLPSSQALVCEEPLHVRVERTTPTSNKNGSTAKQSPFERSLSPVMYEIPLQGLHLQISVTHQIGMASIGLDESIQLIITADNFGLNTATHPLLLTPTPTLTASEGSPTHEQDATDSQATSNPNDDENLPVEATAAIPVPITNDSTPQISDINKPPPSSTLTATNSMQSSLPPPKCPIIGQVSLGLNSRTSPVASSHPSTTFYLSPNTTPTLECCTPASELVSEATTDGMKVRVVEMDLAALSGATTHLQVAVGEESQILPTALVLLNEFTLRHVHTQPQHSPLPPNPILKIALLDQNGSVVSMGMSPIHLPSLSKGPLTSHIPFNHGGASALLLLTMSATHRPQSVQSVGSSSLHWTTSPSPCALSSAPPSPVSYHRGAMMQQTVLPKVATTPTPTNEIGQLKVEILNIFVTPQTDINSNGIYVVGKTGTCSQQTSTRRGNSAVWCEILQLSIALKNNVVESDTMALELWKTQNPTEPEGAERFAVGSLKLNRLRKGCKCRKVIRLRADHSKQKIADLHLMVHATNFGLERQDYPRHCGRAIKWMPGEMTTLDENDIFMGVETEPQLGENNYNVDSINCYSDVSSIEDGQTPDNDDTDVLVLMNSKGTPCHDHTNTPVLISPTKKRGTDAPACDTYLSHPTTAEVVTDPYGRPISMRRAAQMYFGTGMLNSTDRRVTPVVDGDKILRHAHGYPVLTTRPELVTMPNGTPLCDALGKVVDIEQARALAWPQWDGEGNPDASFIMLHGPDGRVLIEKTGTPIVVRYPLQGSQGTQGDTLVRSKTNDTIQLAEDEGPLTVDRVLQLHKEGRITVLVGSDTLTPLTDKQKQPTAAPVTTVLQSVNTTTEMVSSSGESMIEYQETPSPCHSQQQQPQQLTHSAILNQGSGRSRSSTPNSDISSLTLCSTPSLTPRKQVSPCPSIENGRFPSPIPIPTTLNVEKPASILKPEKVLFPEKQCTDTNSSTSSTPAKRKAITPSRGRRESSPPASKRYQTPPYTRPTCSTRQTLVSRQSTSGARKTPERSPSQNKTPTRTRSLSNSDHKRTTPPSKIIKMQPLTPSLPVVMSELITSITQPAATALTAYDTSSSSHSEHSNRRLNPRQSGQHQSLTPTRTRESFSSSGSIGNVAGLARQEDKEKRRRSATSVTSVTTSGQLTRATDTIETRHSVMVTRTRRSLSAGATKRTGVLLQAQGNESTSTSSLDDNVITCGLHVTDGTKMGVKKARMKYNSVRVIQATGPAATAGILPGDFILKVGSHEVSTLADFKLAVSKLQAGIPVAVKLERNQYVLDTRLCPVFAPRKVVEKRSRTSTLDNKQHSITNNLFPTRKMLHSHTTKMLSVRPPSSNISESTTESYASSDFGHHDCHTDSQSECTDLQSFGTDMTQRHHDSYMTLAVQHVHQLEGHSRHVISMNELEERGVLKKAQSKECQALVSQTAGYTILRLVRSMEQQERENRSGIACEQTDDWTKLENMWITTKQKYRNMAMISPIQNNTLPSSTFNDSTTTRCSYQHLLFSQQPQPQPQPRPHPQQPQQLKYDGASSVEIHSARSTSSRSSDGSSPSPSESSGPSSITSSLKDVTYLGGISCVGPPLRSPPLRELPQPATELKKHLEENASSSFGGSASSNCPMMQAIPVLYYRSNP